MDILNNNTFAFVLGREKELALSELEAVLSRFDFCFDLRISGNVAFAKMENFSDAKVKELMSELAGTTKIYRLIQNSKLKPHNDCSHFMAELLENVDRNGSFNFGISEYSSSPAESGSRSSRQGSNNINAMGLEIKKALKEKGVSSRFVALTEGSELTTIQSLKNKLDSSGIEIGIFDEGIGVLVALNDPEVWAKIDFDKPATDKFSGMIPPRLAREMINLAISQIESHESRVTNHEKILLVDAFCGSGNILLEGMRLGLPVIGSDISEKAVKDSLENCRWYNSIFEKGNYFVFQADATNEALLRKLESRISKSETKNILFVSEPYLGVPKKEKTALKSIVEEYSSIKDLYLKFLENLSHLRELNNLSICLVFPLIETSDKGRYSLFSDCVDEIEKIGYTQVRTSLIYGRDYQVVKREIVMLSLKAK